jgi:hypothetical protein
VKLSADIHLCPAIVSEALTTGEAKVPLLTPVPPTKLTEVGVMVVMLLRDVSNVMPTVKLSPVRLTPPPKMPLGSTPKKRRRSR